MSEDKQKKTGSQSKAIEVLTAERDEYLNGWKRALADYENLQKETSERVQSRVQSETDGIVHELLSISDIFDTALLHAPESVQKESWMQGVIHVKRQLTELLQTLHVTEVPIEGVFNPELHEAVETESDETKPDNHVVSVQSKGYMRNNKLIRPSKVIVNKIKSSYNATH